MSIFNLLICDIDDKDQAMKNIEEDIDFRIVTLIKM